MAVVKLKAKKTKQKGRGRARGRGQGGRGRQGRGRGRGVAGGRLSRLLPRKRKAPEPEEVLPLPVEPAQADDDSALGHVTADDDPEQLPGTSSGSGLNRACDAETAGEGQVEAASSSNSLPANSAATGAPDCAAPEEALLEPAAEPTAPELTLPDRSGSVPSPSGSAPPGLAQSASPPPGSAVPSSKAPPASGSKVKGIRINRSPAEILEQISPPGMIIRLSHNDWRFKVETLGEVKDMAVGSEAPYDKKSFSRSFAGLMTWQACLTEVHKHAWERLAYLVSKGKVRAPSQSNTPGVVPQQILDSLDPHIAAMPPPTVYPS